MSMEELLRSDIEHTIVNNYTYKDIIDYKPFLKYDIKGNNDFTI